jgi:cellulose biosynthesis protein BcsQ
VAVNLSACLALHHGKRVLGIDLDPQGNFGISYGIDPRQLDLTSYHLLTSESPQVRDYIMEVKPNLHQDHRTIDRARTNREYGRLRHDGTEYRVLSGVLVLQRGIPPGGISSQEKGSDTQHGAGPSLTEEGEVKSD